MIKAIIFDFDGVIAESVDIKTEAFAELYKYYGDEVVKKVIKHHTGHGGISRYEKFRLYHKIFLNKNIDDNTVNELAQKFSKLVLDKVVRAAFVKGANEFISGNYKRYDLYISSGTPESEMRKIAKRRNINQYFKGIYGSPYTKSEHVALILKEKNYNPSEVLYFGDAPSDKIAALENGIQFIARVNSKDSPLRKEQYIISDLVDLDEYIHKIPLVYF